MHLTFSDVPLIYPAGVIITIHVHVHTPSCCDHFFHHFFPSYHTFPVSSLATPSSRFSRCPCVYEPEDDLQMCDASFRVMNTILNHFSPIMSRAFYYFPT